MSPTVTEVILHCQKQIKKDPPEDKLLHYIGRLKRLRIHIHDLVDTGIGRTVNQLSRLEGPVGEEAWSLVQHWKAVVEAERSADSTNESGSGDSSSNDEEDDDEGDGAEGEPVLSKQSPTASDSPARAEVVTSSLAELPTSTVDGPLSREPDDEADEDSDSDSQYSDRLCIDDKLVITPSPVVETRILPSSSSSSSSSSGSSSSSESDTEVADPLPKPQQKPLEKEPNGLREVSKAASPNPVALPTKDKHRPSQPFSEFHQQELHQVKQEAKSSSSSTDEESVPQPPKHSRHTHSHRSPTKSDSKRPHSPAKPDLTKVKVERNESSIKAEPSRHLSPAKTDKQRDHRSPKPDSSRHKSPTKSDSKKDSDRHLKREKHESKTSSSKSHSHSSSKEKSKSQHSERHGSSNHKEKERKSEKSSSHSSEIKIKKEPSESQSLNGESKQKVKDKDSHESSSKSKEKTEEKVRRGQDVKKEKDRDEKRDSKRKGEPTDDKQVTKKIRLEDEPSKIPSKKSFSSSNSLKPKLLPRLNVEIDSTSGVNFADVLGGLDTKTLNKSSRSKKSDKDKKSKKSSSIILPPTKAGNGLISKIITPNVHISPHYTPSSSSSAAGYSSKAAASGGSKVTSLSESAGYRTKIQSALVESLNDRKYWEDSGVALEAGSYESEGDALSKMITSRNQRSKVYSGVKTGFVGKMPTLFEMCLRVIQDNIDDLGYTGGVPYEILEPALAKTTPTQLQQVENYNPYLIESTDGLWRFHCHHDFRNSKPDELESWRELYFRSIEERNIRLEKLTNKFKTQLEVAVPVRKTKLAYVDTSHSGPKFSKTKAATIKTGMNSLKTREEKGGRRGHGSSASSGGNNNQDNIVVEEASVIINGKSRRSAGSSSTSSASAVVTAAKLKPKKAPLMQKTLKSMKTLLRR